MDYRDAKPKLQNNGLDVERLTVVGLLAGQVPTIGRSTRLGASALSIDYLPDVLYMSIAGMRGNQAIKCHPDEQALAVFISRAVRATVRSLGLELVEALVEVKLGGKRVGDHDMVYGILDCRAALPGYFSVELKCRHLCSERGKRETRLNLQRGCCDSLPWWLTQEKQQYVGRAIVMAVFPDKDGDTFNLYADIKLNGETKWRGLFGWLQSVPSIVPPLQPPPPPVSQANAQAKAHANATAQAHAKAQPKVQARAHPNAKAVPKAQALAQAQARAKAAAEAQLRRFGVQFRLVEGVWVAEVNDKNVGYWSKMAQDMHNWSSSELFRSVRGYATANRGVTRQKLGGSHTWFATRIVCAQMLMDWAPGA